MIKIKPKTLTTIIASAVLAVAPLINGCGTEKMPVYGPADPNGNCKLIGYYNRTHISTGIKIGTYDSDKKQQYEPNTP